MKDPNKKNSFLFSLYQKYKKNQEHLEPGETQNAAALIEETIQEVNGTGIPPEKAYLQPLYELYQYYFRECEWEGEALDLLSFEERCLTPVKDITDESAAAGIAFFERILCKEAGQQLRELMAEQENERPLEPMEEGAAAAGDGEIPAPQPQDALCRAYVTRDKMAAYLFAIPPRNGGKPLDRESIADCLEREGITYGLDILALSRMAEAQSYFQIFPAARGTWPVDGKDGVVIPQIDCDTEIEIRQNEQDISDFKNINSVHCAAKDQVICVILLPEAGAPGTTVKGETVRARDGKPAPDPVGKNTALSPDKTRLLAGLDGQITLRNGRYHMEPVLIIDGDVDYGVGNINFAGDVVIKGDVCNGFTVKAQGSITVRGMVESAALIAGGDVRISKGMNGDFNGQIDAKGLVKTSFLENCTVNAEGPLYAGSIVASKISCGDTVYVLEKHGAIIGGAITAYKSVEAKVIGSQSRRETVIALGELPRMQEKKAQAQEELKVIQDMLGKLNKNVNYLTGIRETLPPEKLEIFNQLKLQQTLYEGRKTELMESLVQLSGTKRDFSQCKVKCGLIFPPTKITIGSETLLLHDATRQTTIYLTADGIMVGML